MRSLTHAVAESDERAREKAIILPYALFMRIKASAEAHNGVGWGKNFENGETGAPFGPHGHAWGTSARYQREKGLPLGAEPELARYLSVAESDQFMYHFGIGGSVKPGQDLHRISFEKWCWLLNVKCGPAHGV